MAKNRWTTFRFAAALVTLVVAMSSVGLGARQSLVGSLLNPVLALLNPVLDLLTNDLLQQLTTRPDVPVRIIVRGNVPELLEVASRHRVPVVRRLDEFIVTVANAAQIAALAKERAVVGLASDLPVRSAMKVSDRAIAADQTRAGVAGSWLLGLGGVEGVTGRGVGVAIVDSGISPHQALSNKVVAAVSFVPGDPSVQDGFGHGTHIAGIVAGAGSAAAKVTSEYSGGVAPGRASRERARAR
jgi:subtilisin family serine protease